MLLRIGPIITSAALLALLLAPVASASGMDYIGAQSASPDTPSIVDQEEIRWVRFESQSQAGGFGGLFSFLNGLPWGKVGNNQVCSPTCTVGGSSGWAVHIHSQIHRSATGFVMGLYTNQTISGTDYPNTQISKCNTGVTTITVPGTNYCSDSGLTGQSIADPYYWIAVLVADGCSSCNGQQHGWSYFTANYGASGYPAFTTYHTGGYADLPSAWSSVSSEATAASAGYMAMWVHVGN